MNWTRGWWWLRRWVLVLWRDIISNVLGDLLFGRLGEMILRRVGATSFLDHPHTKHARDALWGHLAHERPDGEDPLPMPLCLALNGEDNEIGKVDDVPVRHTPKKVGVVPQRWRECRCLRVARLVGGSARGEGVPTPRGKVVDVEWRVSWSFSSLNSSVYRPKAIPSTGMFNWWTRPPRQNWIIPGKGWRLSAVGPKEDDAPFFFFEAGIAVFFPRQDDMVTL
ncbi:hypothetical protein GOBAR_AA33312 [Gossypium barbadense]|uniref:Uncharacterized protein n=1 Tax=Gossypium barbadense TaxID=3634 RepID=A0A2P5W8F5_GOSBA|nr:hypothetical protein GOBAR_AA33312 [Gossypium barbadense]